MRYRYTRRNGKTYVSCTRCGENLVPAPTTFEEDPICWECCPLPAVSERTHFAGLVAMLCAAEAAVVCTLLGGGRHQAHVRAGVGHDHPVVMNV